MALTSSPTQGKRIQINMMRGRRESLMSDIVISRRGRFKFLRGQVEY